jgi:uncharacterized membrane protein required for colicin V production
MLSKYLIGLNWIDFLIIGAIARACFIGIKTGTGIELFKLLSLWFVTVVSFHIYTTPLSDYLNTKLPALPLDAGDVFVFCCLVTVITLLFRIIRESFFLLVKIEANNILDKWAGLAIGCLRGFWIASIGLFIFTISTVPYLEISAKSSLIGHNILVMAPNIYKAGAEGFINKIIPSYGPPNEEVFKAVNR